MVKAKKHILIVDDSMAVRKLMKMVIQRDMDYHLMEAEDGQRAYELLQSNGCDLLITDINMPHMNGLSLIGLVRNELCLRIPIVVVSTMGHEEDRDAAIKLGADTYITKPINGSRLLETVNGLIA